MPLFCSCASTLCPGVKLGLILLKAVVNTAQFLGKGPADLKTQDYYHGYENDTQCQAVSVPWTGPVHKFLKWHLWQRPLVITEMPAHPQYPRLSRVISVPDGPGI